MSSMVRFTKIVDQAGQPRLHVLWGPPESDKNFQQAVKTKRVMTIRQENIGSKKDFGLIGFFQEAPAQFLIFPRTLKAYEGQRVVGINYELLDPSPEPGAANPKGPAAKKKGNPVPPERPAKPVSEPAKDGRVNDREPEEPERREPDSVEVIAPARLVEDSKVVEMPRPKVPGTPQKTPRELDRGVVLKELKSAMKELEAGKAVLVFRRLEKLAKRLATDA